MARAPSPRAEAERRQSRMPGGEPWLEEADHEEAPAQTLIGRRTAIGLIAALLLLVALVAAGLFLVTKRADAPIDVPTGEIPLVRSPGPWKVPAEGPGTEGVPVEGQGQLLFPAGEGLETEAEIDPARLPEEPRPLPQEPRPLPQEPPEDLLPDAAAAPAPPPASEARPAPVAPAPSRPRAAEPPAAAPVAAQGTIQLGAFSSQERARATWKELAARFPWLKDYSPAFLPMEREGQTLWRLRASGPDASGVCDRLKIAGEECALVR